eukprot:3332559-Rhodomonas_salina.2
MCVCVRDHTSCPDPIRFPIIGPATEREREVGQRETETHRRQPASDSIHAMQFRLAQRSNRRVKQLFTL